MPHPPPFEDGKSSTYPPLSRYKNPFGLTMSTTPRPPEIPHLARRAGLDKSRVEWGGTKCGYQFGIGKKTES